MRIPSVALLTVGDEVLGGRTVNTNAAYLGQRLSDQGFVVVATETVGDDEFTIADAIDGLCGRADAVIVTGGLGPTPDDVTREALAGVANRLLVVDKGLKKIIADRTGGRAPRRNARQARVPEGSVIFPNPVGTAAGLRTEVGGTPVYAVPGVPLEMETVFELGVLPDLRETFATVEPPPQQVLCTFGLREAEVAETLGALLERGKGPLVGVTARHGVIKVTVSGKGAEKRADAIRKKLGKHLFGEGDMTLAKVVLDALKERGLTLGTAESLTGGLLASTIVSEPGASAVFQGSVIAYAAGLKNSMLGVPKTVLKKEGTVSKETALRMARGARKVLGVDVALATTGVAGPDLDERGTPAGTGWVAVVMKVKGKKIVEAVRRVRTTGGRNIVRRRFCSNALDLLRRKL